MSNSTQQAKVLGRFPAQSFVGRQRELTEILRHAKGENSGRGLLVLAPPLDGASELLRQVYDALFYEQGATIPFYFDVNKADVTAENAARRFLQTFLLQVVAFRRNDSTLFDSAPDIREIVELATPEDLLWINPLVTACEHENKLGDVRSFVRNCLSAPLRAAANGAPSVVMIDDFHHTETFAGDVSFVAEINQIYERSTIQFVIAGRRRFVLGATQNGETDLQNTTVLRLSSLTPTEAGTLTEALAKSYHVKLNEQTRDLIVQKLESNPTFITNLLLAARDKGVDLDGFQNFQGLYVEEILGGRINRHFAGIFDEIAPNAETQREILSVLFEVITTHQHKSPIEFWRKRINVSSEEFYKIMRRLHLQELVRLNSSLVEISEDETNVARDYVRSRHRLEIEAAPRALVYSDFLADSLKRAPQIMARYYRRSAAIGVRDLVANFKLQSVPTVLFDYARFKRSYKGAHENEIAAQIQAETDETVLPQIVYGANCVEFYPLIQGIIDDERCAVALGFDSGYFTDDNQIVWIVAEIESKLEATSELTGFWLDRLEAVAVFCNFSRYKFWLVAPEGFASDAVDLLKERNALGSSFAQVEILARQIKAANVIKQTPRENPNEYEIVVPMGDDTELIAAQAVEEIARRCDFKPLAINQIKTALIEACINATEHSLSPDQKIYQKFAIEKDKLVITISNRGVQMPATVKNGSGETATPSGRRGWGLKLIRNLMDEVEFEQVDDGTRIRMAKYLDKTS